MRGKNWGVNAVNFENKIKVIHSLWITLWISLWITEKIKVVHKKKI